MSPSGLTGGGGGLISRIVQLTTGRSGLFFIGVQPVVGRRIASRTGRPRCLDYTLGCLHKQGVRNHCLRAHSRRLVSRFHHRGKRHRRHSIHHPRNHDCFGMVRHRNPVSPG